MSTPLLDVRAPDIPHSHSPTPPTLSIRRLRELPDPPAPLGLVDRASLQLGLWLLLRSTRSATRRADHASRARLVADEQSRLAREAAALRLQRLRPWL